MELEVIKLRRTVREYARANLLDFIKLQQEATDSDKNWKLWLIASGQHKGRGIVSTKQAAMLQKLYKDAEGWWVNFKTFIPNEEWLPEAESKLKR